MASHDKAQLLEKMRRLAAHPSTDDATRSVVCARLDVIAPRRPRLMPGVPSRRASDRAASGSPARTDDQRLTSQQGGESGAWLNRIAHDAYQWSSRYEIGPTHHDLVL